MNSIYDIRIEVQAYNLFVAEVEILYDEDVQDPTADDDYYQVTYCSSVSQFDKAAQDTFPGEIHSTVNKLVGGEVVMIEGEAYLGIGAYRHGLTKLCLCGTKTFPDMQWDYSPLVGWVKLSKELVEHIGNSSEADLRAAAKSCLSEYEAYLNGECYVYHVTIKEFAENGWERELTDEWCGGFLADMEGCQEAALDTARGLLKVFAPPGRVDEVIPETAKWEDYE